MAIDISLIFFDLNSKKKDFPKDSDIAMILQIGQGLSQDIYLMAEEVISEAGPVHLNQIFKECEGVRDIMAKSPTSELKSEDPQTLDDLRDKYAKTMFEWAFQNQELLTSITVQAQGAKTKRIRICIPYNSARLRRFPFELMEVRPQWLQNFPWIPQGPLSTCAGLSLVRSLPMGFRDMTPAEVQTLNVLIIGQESPKDVDLPAIDVGGEIKAVKNCLQNLNNVNVVELDINSSLNNIQNCVKNENIHCVHVIAHGCEQIPNKNIPGLVFHGSDGNAQFVNCNQFITAVLSQAGQNRPRLVFLNACYSEGFSSELLRCGIPAVVATQFPVGDCHGRQFAETFYSTLISDGNIESAVLSGRQSLYVSGSVQWASYALYLQSSHGQLFEPQEPPPGLEWIHIPAGTYKAGSEHSQMVELLNKFGMSEQGNLETLLKPIKEQHVNEFWITKYPITNIVYEGFVNEHPQYSPKNWPYSPSKANHPVTHISADAAQAFARWMNADLPTIPQWEKAARGAQDLRDYPWGNEFDSQHCNCAEKNISGTSEVGQHPGGDSPYGVSDMIGNVREWVHERNEHGFVGCKGSAFDMTCEIYGLIHFTVWVQNGAADDDTGFRLVSKVTPNNYLQTNEYDNRSSLSVQR